MPVPPPITARVMAREAPTHWKSAAKLVMAARVPAQKGPAPEGWKSAVRLMMAASLPAQEAPADWKSAEVVKCCFLAKTAARLLDQVASLTFFACLCGGGASCGDGASDSDAGCGDSAGNGGASCGN